MPEVTSSDAVETSSGSAASRGRGGRGRTYIAVALADLAAGDNRQLRGAGHTVTVIAGRDIIRGG